MKFFRNASIRHKQMLIVLLTTGIALLLVCAAFAVFEAVTFRKEMVRGLSTVAEIIGDNTAAAVDFDDAKSAEETLSALKAKPEIIGACIYAKDGNFFAGYDRANDAITFAPPARPGTGHTFANSKLKLFHPIVFKGESIGAIYFESDMRALYARLGLYCVIIAAIFVVTLILAAMLSAKLQRLISQPILELAQTARAVAQDKNYSLRVRRSNPDEIGVLIEDFNEMLAQIQERDANLENRVQARTDELAQSLSLLNATLESIADGLLAVDRSGKIMLFNARFAAMWGFPKEMLERRNAPEMIAYAIAQIKDADREKITGRVNAVMANPERESYEVIELKDGRVFERFALPQWMNNECVGMVVNWRDITERRRMEVALAYERELLRSLLDYSPDYIYFKDSESRFIRCSETMARMFGLDSADELVGKSDFDFFADEHAQEAFDDEQKIIRTGEPLVGSVEREILKNGNESWALTSKMPLRNTAGEIIGTFGTSKDISSLKAAESKLEQVHKQLLDTSRQAGMAEVATSVLHNVGNVLNSVNVAATMLIDHNKKSKVAQLEKISALLDENAANVSAFIADDPRGKQIPAYIKQLAQHLIGEKEVAVEELETLRKHIEHIKDIVSMQQSYAKFSGVSETVKVSDLVEDALRMNAGALVRHDVRVVRDFQHTPEINVEKHKVLQILVNLIRNAKYACDESGRQDKLMTLRVSNGDDHVRISVIDNGVGIPAENMVRIFNHGFTTRKEGHGFGLHSGALAARELGGKLKVHSDGIGAGATFTLELPTSPAEQLDYGNDQN